MKFILFFSSLLAALVSAAPKEPATGVFINVQQQNPDAASTTFPIPYGILTEIKNPTESGFVIGVAFVDGVPVSELNIVCQAFSDVAGKVLLGIPFNKSYPARISKSDNPARIGSVFCADIVGVVAQIKKASARRPGRPAAP